MNNLEKDEMKLLNTVFIVLFTFSAAFQYNDDDFYIWIPIYLYGATLCFFALKRKYNKILYIIGFAVYFSYAFFLILSKNGVLVWLKEHQAENIVQSMKAVKPWIEETREFFGLLLLIFALFANVVWLSRTRQLEEVEN